MTKYMINVKTKCSLALRAGSVGLLIAAAFLIKSDAGAQNASVVPYEADAAYNAYNANFLVQSGGDAYYNSKLNSVGTAEAGTWIAALDIAVAEDNYEATLSPAAQQLVRSLLNRFEVKNGKDWSYDGWDDDIGWMVNAFIRGYQITGDTGYLTIAQNNFKMAYNRGWDGATGGVWENTDKHSKCALSNDPFVWEAVDLYKVTRDITYLTEAKQMYDWVRTYLFNSTSSTNSLGAPGQVNEGVTPSGGLQSSDNMYNSGSFLEAANALYQVTRNAEYYNDAILDINHVIGNGPVLHSRAEAPGNQWAYWFIKGLSDFCTDNKLWSTYYPWMLGNANAAWSERDSLNLTWNDWTSPTSDAGTDAVEMGSAADIWQLLPVQKQSQIINAQSGLAMDLNNGNEGSDAAIELWSPSSSVNAHQQWILTPLASGYFAIISAETGMAASIRGDSTLNGATLVDMPYSVNNAAQQFAMVSQGDGRYELKNLNSGLMLGDPAGGSNNGTVISQWPADGRATQMWKVRPVTSRP